MDAKLLATIIAIAKKESQGYLSDFSKLDVKVESQLKALEVKLESQLKALHKEDPITQTPGFVLHNGCLHCTWPSGRSSNLGPVLGKDGINGKDGTNGKDGINGKDGRDGKDGAAAAAGRDGKQGLTGAVGPRGEPGQDGKQGVPGNDGKAAERGLQGLPGVDGLDGEDGVGVEKAWVDDNHHLTIKLTSGKVVDAGYVRGPAGVSAGKGGRVTGGYSGGGSGSNFYVTGADFNTSNELIITNSNGTSINAGAPLADGGLVSPSFTYTDGLLSRIDYTGGQFKTLTYTGSQLTSVVLTNGSEVTTKTLSYGLDGSLTSISQT